MQLVWLVLCLESAVVGQGTGRQKEASLRQPHSKVTRVASTVQDLNWSAEDL